MKKVLIILDFIVESICALLLLIMTGAVFLQVFCRYILVSPIGWTEEISRGTLIWITFLGTYLAFRRGMHMKISLLIKKLSPILKKICYILSLFCISIISIVLINNGFIFTFKFGNMSASSLDVPMKFFYIVIPLAGILFMIFVIWESIKLFLENKKR